MRIVDFVRPELVLPSLHATDKAGVIRELAAHLAAHIGAIGPTGQNTTPPARVEADTLSKVLLDRERLASTAIGEGVAIPHGKLDAVGRLVACVGRAENGVEFESMDGQPTYLFFVLVAPENSTGLHLKALARISRLFKDPNFRSRLMAAPTAIDMFTILADEDAKY